MPRNPVELVKDPDSDEKPLERIISAPEARRTRVGGIVHVEAAACGVRKRSP